MQALAPMREQRIIDPTQVKGWSVDADPENDPTYPMRMRTDSVHEGYTWDRPQQQFIDIEVLRSNERPNVSATFGTSNPPAGLSGMIRREAFKFSENSYGHWVPLMLADRIGVFEGLLSDLARGYVPNVFSELGWKAEWRHNRKALVTKVAVGSVIAVGLIALLARKKDRL